MRREAHLPGGRVEFLERPLHHLERILPERFVRIHRSCIVCVDQVGASEHKGASVYAVRLENGEVLPLSRRGRVLIVTIVQA